MAYRPRLPEYLKPFIDTIKDKKPEELSHLLIGHEIGEPIQYEKIEPYLNGNEDNVLVIGDLHEPFSRDDYLPFCRQVQKEYDCGQVVFIGDIIDNHYSSFHTTDPDGFGAGEELERAVYRIQRWSYTFPDAYVTIGNHDRMAFRKAADSGVSKRWIKDYADVLNVDWDFVEEVTINRVTYVHGDGGGKARSKIKKELQSIVQGHYHCDGYIDYIVGRKYKVFGMQVGCGIDHKAYAMAYAKRGPKPFIGCGVIIGNLPVLVPMNL